jgi:hypothetical protein
MAKFSPKVTLCGDARLDPESNALIAVPGKGVVMAQTRIHRSNLLSKKRFGDCHVQLEFLMGKRANSGVKLQERYEIQLLDSYGKSNPTAKDCGGIYPHWRFRKNGRGLDYIDKGYPPRFNAAKPAGEWQKLEIIFRAPRFDANGKKKENARFVSVELNGIVIHENVELDSPTGNSSNPLPETASAPLFLQLDHGAVAFRNVRVRPITDP